VIQPKTSIQLKKEELIVNSDEEDEPNNIDELDERIKVVDEPIKVVEEPIKVVEEPIKVVEECLEESDIHELTDLDLEDLENDSMILKKPQEVYYNIYRQARKKARLLKHQALLAFLEAKNIKKTYKLEDLEDDDSVISDLDFKSIEETLNYNMDI
jgi:hypothetical protein